METKFNKLFKQIMNQCVKSQSKYIEQQPDPNCPDCHGTGYIKSHSDAPDMKCPCDKDYQKPIDDGQIYDDDLSDGEIDAIIAKNRMSRIGLGDLYNQNKKKIKLVKESSVTLPDENIKCEICGKQINHQVQYDKYAGTQYLDDQLDFSCEDPEFYHEHVCMNCAEKEAGKYQQRFINGIDQNEHILEFIDNKDNDTWIACAGCGTLYPENELKDTDAGNICPDCLDGYVSRGEDISVHYNRY